MIVLSRNIPRAFPLSPSDGEKVGVRGTPARTSDAVLIDDAPKLLAFYTYNFTPCAL